ncbi:1-(5-phosphoribosyl)-5-[(5-phosphoribosylamino)methylideneamino]imidazole-4-carboxamide isomerase [Thermosulfuriphilus sp.]
MLVVPAIDLKGGRCVRLFQGQMDKETVFSEDPASVALRWQNEGAELLHVVDLDGAIEGRPVNFKEIMEILKVVSIPVELGGGIRDLETIEKYLSLGIDRIILGTVACRDPKLVREACRLFPDKIVVGIDVRGDQVAVSGWVDTVEVYFLDLARLFEEAGVRAIIFTDISRDGTRSGVNIEKTRSLLEAVSVPVYAAGGVSNLDDIRRLLTLEPLGLEGVITGRAIYTGSLNLREAIALAQKSHV